MGAWHTVDPLIVVLHLGWGYETNFLRSVIFTLFFRINETLVIENNKFIFEPPASYIPGELIVIIGFDNRCQTGCYKSWTELVSIDVVFILSISDDQAWWRS